MESPFTRRVQIPFSRAELSLIIKASHSIFFDTENVTENEFAIENSLKEPKHKIKY